MKDSDEFTSIWRDYSRAFRPPDLLLGIRLTHAAQSAKPALVTDKPEQPFKLLPLRPAP